MRNILLFLLLVFFSSCGMNEVEKLVADYEQSFGNSKMDLKFKPIQTTFVKNITARDSAKFYQQFYDSAFNAHIEARLLVIEDMENYLADWIVKRNEADGALKSVYNNIVVDYEDRLVELKDRFEIAKNNPDDLFKEEWLDKKKYYELKADEILCIVYEVEYSILNPVLEIKQIKKNKYFISADKTSIIDVEEK